MKAKATPKKDSKVKDKMMEKMVPKMGGKDRMDGKKDADPKAKPPMVKGKEEHKDTKMGGKKKKVRNMGRGD